MMNNEIKPRVGKGIIYHYDGEKSDIQNDGQVAIKDKKACKARSKVPGL